jgi:hypothetical protein
MNNDRTKLLCPQCKIGRFQVKNESGESVVVIVTDQHEIIPLHEGTSLDGFDLTVLYCLGCSWKGSDKRLTNK